MRDKQITLDDITVNMDRDIPIHNSSTGLAGLHSPNKDMYFNPSTLKYKIVFSTPNKEINDKLPFFNRDYQKFEYTDPLEAITKYNSLNTYELLEK